MESGNQPKSATALFFLLFFVNSSKNDCSIIGQVKFSRQTKGDRSGEKMNTKSSSFALCIGETNVASWKKKGGVEAVSSIDSNVIAVESIRLFASSKV